MFFKRPNFFTIVLVILFLGGCATTSGYKSNSSLNGISFYNMDTKSGLENDQQKPAQALGKHNLFAKETSGFFLMEPDSQTWKAYYYFFHLRKRIFEDLPRIVPESEHDIPIVLNDKVQGFLQYFQNGGHDLFSEWLGRSGKYIPMMKEILEAKAMPLDLVYLAMIESGFNMRARSNKGAVGPWQFIEPTARRYGLRVDSWVDERMDPEKSTEAAANYLHDLYDMFDSWELAAAGYNAGENTVRSAMEKFQISDFWKISEYTLPEETRDYVPKLIAALIIAKNPGKYGFSEIQYQEPEPFEKANVPAQRSLRDISRISGIQYERLSDLNPSLVKGFTPPSSTYEINVPVGYKTIIEAKYDEIDAAPMRAATKSSIANSLTYRIRHGDTLEKIASRYNVSVSTLKNTNGIKGSNVKIGQVISISSPRAHSDENNNEENTSFKITTTNNSQNLKVQKTIAALNNSSARSLSKSTQKSDTKNVVNYHVRRGDTIWNIATKYDVSVSEIKKWNNLKSSRLPAGDRLKIYVE
jgi:membrane-bound lytic murein transglycosylase D